MQVQRATRNDDRAAPIMFADAQRTDVGPFSGHEFGVDVHPLKDVGPRRAALGRAMHDDSVRPADDVAQSIEAGGGRADGIEKEVGVLFRIAFGPEPRPVVQFDNRIERAAQHPVCVPGVEKVDDRHQHRRKRERQRHTHT